jgi:hypothetical protein
LEHANRLSYRYTNRPYRSPVPRQRVIVQLAPLRVRDSLELARQLAAAHSRSE